jgi:hypothetical protein
MYLKEVFMDNIINKINELYTVKENDNGKYVEINEIPVAIHKIAYELMHNTKVEPKNCVVPIDGDYDNLSNYNLYIITKLHKVATEGLTGANKTGFKGVSAIKRGKVIKYRATASKWIEDYKLIVTREFETAVEAAIYYNKIIVEFYGSKVFINSVEESLKEIDNLFGE